MFVSPRSLCGRSMLSVVVLAATLQFAFAAESTPAVKVDNGELQQVADQLSQTLAAIEGKREQLKTLKQSLKSAQEGERAAVETQIAETQKFLAASRDHFVALAVGGVSLDTPDADEALNWQAEVLEIAKPLVSALKSLTEKPRAMDRLRTQIGMQEDNLERIDAALASLKRTAEAGLEPTVAARVGALDAEWQGRRQATEQDLEILRYQLAQEQGNTGSILGDLNENLGEFLRGRGLTLILAIAAAFLTWWGMRWLRRLVFRTNDPESARLRSPGYRLALFALRGLSWLLAVMMAVFVLYVAGDWFLLGLALIVLIGAAISLKNTLPKYIDEAKLFLNLGPVREGERVIYGGLPWRVRTLNIDSSLYNPDLYGGILRLPVSVMETLTSRPYHKDEPWFPTRTGDFVLMDGEVVAKVLMQTPEVVSLSYKGAVRQIPAADFVGMPMTNLSQDGFVVPVVFGIDYSHQGICLDQVAPRFKEAVEARLGADFGDDLVEVKALFKGAGANSLDYLILAVMQSERRR